MNNLSLSEAVVSLTAGEDQSAKRGCFVKFNSGAATLVSAVTDSPIGVVLDGDVASGKSSIALFNVGAVVKVKCHGTPGTINPGTQLQIHTDATVKADAGTGQRTVVGLALETGASNALIDAILFKPVYSAS